MKRRFILAIGVGVALAAPVQAQKAAVPDNLRFPAGERPVLTLKAKGVQIYECKLGAQDPSKREWTFTAPEAQLVDTRGKPFGKHFAGPTWLANDGSKVVGELRARADAPDGKAIPLLLLAAKSTEGAGVFANVKSIQRLDTVGGKPPARCSKAELGKTLRVRYSATYVFSVGG
jgi:hypothetical protein